jgi:DNA-directed RNA polymerase subunit RPC12/RpoP
VDHRLIRRALINEYRRGRLRKDQVCDAHPELVRAAVNVGEETRVNCPICDERRLVLVTYVFGPRLPAHGRCVSTKRELAQLNRRTDELAAYFVEVCPDCRWHHLLRVQPLGGPKRRLASGG